MRASLGPIHTCRWNMSFSMSMPARHSDLLDSPIGDRMPEVET